MLNIFEPTIAVILCTFKRYDLALNCLRFLSNQTYPRMNYKICVVDNTPISLREQYDWVSLGADIFVTEDLPGLSRARNRGISNSKSDYVVFVDDDAEVTNTWLSKIVETFQYNSQALAVGGKVLAKYSSEKPAWLTKKLEEFLSCIDWGTGTFPIQNHQWIVGANMAFKRSVFDKYGFFNVSLGRIGHSTLLSNEETHLLGLLPENSIFYCNDALVYHLIPDDRLSQSWFRKRTYWQAVSDLLAGKKDGENSSYYFDQFASALPFVPAEHRSLRSLCYFCSDGESFERQIQMTYNLIIASGLGLETLDFTDL